MKTLVDSILTALVLVVATTVLAQDPVAITGARILTVTNGVIEHGTILIEHGKISAVGSNLSLPAGTEIIDGRNKTVIPGLIDAGDQLGVVEIPFVAVTDDSNESTDPIRPEVRAIDALNLQSENIRVARPEGVTNAVVTPGGSNVIAGQSALIQLDGESLTEALIKAPAALHINLGELSKETYGNKDQTPKTRMGTMAVIREAFLKAQHYQEIGEKPRDLKMETLVAALKGEIPVVVHANRAGDIEAALRMADEFQLHIILSEAASAWRFAGELAQRKIPVIVGPIFAAPIRSELADLRRDNAALLQKAGVTVAIQTASANGVRDLWFAVGSAMAHGLSPDAALASVTLNPARIFGVDDRLGSIQPGRDANLLLLDGQPFLSKSHVLAVFIRGKKVDLSNHQTRLFDAYKEKYGIK